MAPIVLQHRHWRNRIWYATVICYTGTSREKGHYYLIVKVTPTQVKGILLRTVRVRTVHKTDLSTRYSFLYHLITYDPAYDDDFVKQIPGNRSYHYAGSMDTPLEERMTIKDERSWLGWSAQARRWTRRSRRNVFFFIIIKTKIKKS